MRRKLSSQTVTLMLLIVATVSPPGAYSTDQSIPVSGFKEFNAHVAEYGKVRKEAEKTLPALKKTDKPEIISAHQQALVEKIRELRSNSKQGDIFSRNAAQAIELVIKAVFNGPDSQRVENTIQAGDPLQGFKVEVNQKYPDNLPFTTVPPTLLQKLPRLPDDVTYRILGTTLLLVDRKANMIVDYMPNAIP